MRNNDTLEPKDLMINDVVYYDPNCFIEDEYVPIKDIELSKIGNGEDIICGENDCFYPVSLHRFSPEAYGFRKIEGFTGIFYRFDDNLTIKEYDNNYYVLSYDKGMFQVTLKVRYFHELQQLLRRIGYSDIADSMYEKITEHK